MNKIVKYTISDPRFTEKVIDAATENVEAKTAIIKGRDGDSVLQLKPHMMSKKLQKFLTDEGYKMETFVSNKRQGRKVIAGIPVKVLPVNHNTYNGGVIISFIGTGEDDKELQDDIKTKSGKITRYMTKYGVPVGRICVEVECVYKFANGETGCEVVS